MKPKLIICIIGESGSGKTTMQEQLEFLLGIPLIESYTDRPKREPNEEGHIFLSKEQFDLLKKEDMIAFTTFGGYRYCCLHSDLKQTNLYVIDESGYKMLKEANKGQYLIKTIRCICPSVKERIKRAGRERVQRDVGKFTIPLEKFDIVYNSEQCSTIFEHKIFIDWIKEWVSQSMNAVKEKKLT